MNGNGVTVLMRGKPFRCACGHSGFFLALDRDAIECVKCQKLYAKRDGEEIVRPK